MQAQIHLPVPTYILPNLCPECPLINLEEQKAAQKNKTWQVENGYAGVRTLDPSHAKRMRCHCATYPARMVRSQNIDLSSSYGESRPAASWLVMGIIPIWMGGCQSYLFSGTGNHNLTVRQWVELISTDQTLPEVCLSLNSSSTLATLVLLRSIYGVVESMTVGPRLSPKHCTWMTLSQNSIFSTIRSATLARYAVPSCVYVGESCIRSRWLEHSKWTPPCVGWTCTTINAVGARAPQPALIDRTGEVAAEAFITSLGKNSTLESLTLPLANVSSEMRVQIQQLTSGTRGCCGWVPDERLTVLWDSVVRVQPCRFRKQQTVWNWARSKHHR